MFYITAPMFLTTMIVVPFVARPAWYITVALETFCVLGMLVLFDFGRFRWAGRALGVLTFAASIAYVGWMFLEGQVIGGRGEPSLVAACSFLFILGIPAIRYAWTGRLDDEPTEEECDADYGQLQDFDLSDANQMNAEA